ASEQAHIVAAGGGAPRRFEAARAAAHHDHALAHRGPSEGSAPELGFAPDARVRDARDRIALREVAVTTLVAAGARPDLGDALVARLVGPIGVGDERAHDRHRV